jgi:hypothetical protein
MNKAAKRKNPAGGSKSFLHLLTFLISLQLIMPAGLLASWQLDEALMTNQEKEVETEAGNANPAPDSRRLHLWHAE